MKEKKEKIIFLEGNKVILRPIRKETDLELFTRFFNDPEVRFYLSSVFPKTIRDEENWFDNQVGKNDNVILSIETREDSRLVGLMGLHRINWISKTAFTGACLGEKEYWGKGYGTDAKMILLNYAFNTLNLRKICSTAYDFNKRSQKYNQKCGYQIEGLRKKQFFVRGSYCDEVLLAVYKKDWLPLWKKYQKENNLK
ncbi:hypothetical protein A2995_00600 [Candidatus Nomurabacteria bacterium RIFCSPLOWO2_01_FULL_33_24]|uniref:N-acetyltransferase domain-containing protein n=1 Tax=Candidatus Nomurabacteria bacterium RIFCSPLOWO2_01_FULL_33_24 TaxID=1801765 RepID=A0A1F6X0Y9_9BACT|nr:MAG: hypothetical protein A2995_00600 [Candidatus Nomurabacteria bacterium RIFCSPLOWO2_01_FULL_33_24]